MARGIPSSRSESEVVPLPNRRITRAPLVSIKAFRTEDEAETKSGDKKLVDRVKLAFAWDSKIAQHDRDGNVIFDEDTGEAKPHLIIDGYVTLSGHGKSKLGGNILPALGFEGDEFYDDEGNMLDSVMRDVEVEFGENALGDDYAGMEWDDLPYYERGNKKVRKGEVEVNVTSFKIAGYELLGREVDLALSIKDGWNRIESYLIPEDFRGLDDEPPPKGKKLAEAERKARGGASKAKAAPRKMSDSGAPPRTPRASQKAKEDDEEKRRNGIEWVVEKLAEAEIEEDAWGATLSSLLHKEIDAPEDLSVADAKRAYQLIANKGIGVLTDAFEASQDEFPDESSLPF